MTGVDLHLDASVVASPLRRKADKRGLLNLSSNELVHPDLDDLVAGALSSSVPSAATRYPYWPVLVDRLADRLQLAPEQLLVAPGSDEIYRMLVHLLAHPSGIVATQEPNYEQLWYYAATRALKVIGIPYRAAGFEADEIVETLHHLPPVALFVSNPNGPTGCLLPLDAMEQIATMCSEHGHLLVIDEAYADFVPIDHLPLVRSHDNVIVVHSFSKGFGLAGGRLAWVAAPVGVIAHLARWNGASGVSGITVAVVDHLLDQADALEAIRQDIRTARAWFVAEIEHRIPDWSALPSAANFVNVDVGHGRPDRLSEHLQTDGILVRSMSSVPHLSTCIRFTIAARPTMQLVLDSVLRFARDGDRSPTPAPRS